MISCDRKKISCDRKNDINENDIGCGSYLLQEKDENRIGKRLILNLKINIFDQIGLKVF